MIWTSTGTQKQKPSPSGFNPSKQLLALSWNIATEPKLYRQLASNPYSHRSLEIISERFPGINVVDVIRAVVWAEPEGRYDRDFRLLETELQEKELCQQRDNSVETNKRLVQFSGKYAKQFSQLPKEFVYSGLSSVAFGTTDLAEIEQRFAQNQRRDFKLSIVNFIEDSQGFAACLKLPHKRKKSVAVAVLLTILLIGFPIGLSVLKSQQNQKTVNYQEAEHQVLGIQKESKALPVRLKIPSINVDANIQQVGVSTDGEMEVPSNTVDVGWFKLGARPSEKGSAVISGHIDGENGIAGVFADLSKLKKNDLLYIEDDKGTLTAFVVRESRIYDPGYADEVFSRNDGAHLNLITCEGLWDETKRSYSERLVVFTDIAN